MLRTGLLDGRDAAPALAERAVPARGVAQPAQQLGAQVVRLDDGVDHELGGQPHEVDVLLVLARAGPATNALALVRGRRSPAILLAYTALTAASGPITAIFAVGSAMRGVGLERRARPSRRARRRRPCAR